jgi:hypothetical protein
MHTLVAIIALPILAAYAAGIFVWGCGVAVVAGARSVCKKTAHMARFKRSARGFQSDNCRG